MLEIRRKWFSFLILLFSLFTVVQLASAEIAHFGYSPKGENPTLYDAASDPIVQLDETSFNDTVFCGERDDCTAYLVEVCFLHLSERHLTTAFSSILTGAVIVGRRSWYFSHSDFRAYAPIYKNVAKDLRLWEEVVRIAAMNCADPANENTCRANGVMYFPFIKVR